MSQMDYLRMLSLTMIVGGLLMYEYGGTTIDWKNPDSFWHRVIGRLLPDICVINRIAAWVQAAILIFLRVERK